MDYERKILEFAQEPIYTVSQKLIEYAKVSGFTEIVKDIQALLTEYEEVLDVSYYKKKEAKEAREAKLLDAEEAGECCLTLEEMDENGGVCFAYKFGLCECLVATEQRSDYWVTKSGRTYCASCGHEIPQRFAKCRFYKPKKQTPTEKALKETEEAVKRDAEYKQNLKLRALMENAQKTIHDREARLKSKKGKTK